MESEQFGLPTSVLRFFSVYGPGQQPNGVSGVVTIFAHAALAGTPLRVQSAGRRDFTDARDVAHGIALALERPPSGPAPTRTLNVATGWATTFRALAEAVVQAAGSRSSIVVEHEDDAGSDLVADIDLARIELGFEPRISLEDGLTHYITWLREERP
jgi:nucleoside-diphosphate-sugar epimerase